MRKHSSERSLRIIGGNWRRRKITFPDREGIRPTPDRVRETLFNWLAPEIGGAQCLELYAGSGVLSMEALSRGAKHVTLVENDRETWNQLQKNLTALAGNEANFLCIHGAALDWIPTNHRVFDIVFLDPPFAGAELLPAINALLEHQALGEDSLVYIESPGRIAPKELPAPLSIIRQGKAGQVYYCLCRMHR